MAAKTKTRRQVRFLFSKGSPLSKGQKAKLGGEIRRGAVRVRRRRKNK